jgi:hypothetical protein
MADRGHKSSDDTSVLIMYVMNFMITTGLGLPLDKSCVHMYTHAYVGVCGGGEGGGGGGWGGEGGESGVTLAPPTSMSLWQLQWMIKTSTKQATHFLTISSRASAP